MTFNPIFLVLLGCLFGLIIGWLVSLLYNRKRLVVAYEEGKAEAELEREQIADDMQVSLGSMRDGLIQTLQAFEETHRKVEETIRPASSATRLTALEDIARRIEHIKNPLEEEVLEDSEILTDTSPKGENTPVAENRSEDSTKGDDLKETEETNNVSTVEEESSECVDNHNSNDFNQKAVNE